MGYLSKVQVIQRGEKNRQYYLICPAPLAQALEMEKSETIEWVVQDRQTLILRRVSGKMGKDRRQGHGKRKGRMHLGNDFGSEFRGADQGEHS